MNKKRYASYNDILEAESQIEQETHEAFGKWFQKFAESMGVLIGLSYLKYDLPDPAEEDDCFYNSAVILLFANIANWFRSCSILLETGHYDQALSLCRSILESLVKYKYYSNKTKLFKKNEISGTSISLNVMLKEITKEDATKQKSDSYKIYKFLCKFTHKSVGTIFLSVSKQDSEEKIITQLPSFKKEMAAIIINHLMYLIFGYLNFAPSVIPFNWKSTEPDFEKNYMEIKDWFENQIKKHSQTSPKGQEWYEALKKIVF